MVNNRMQLCFLSLSQNEGFARVVAGAFVSQLNPTMEELSDVKTAISEAVTNSIIHGYGDEPGMVELWGEIVGNDIHFEVRDSGKGIADIRAAREPFFTTIADGDRSGMGFTVMETFMDTVDVESKLGEGTAVKLRKHISTAEERRTSC